MEYQDNNKPLDELSTLKLMIETLTNRQNEQSLTIAALRAEIAVVGQAMDEATHMTSDQYGQQVIEQIMAALPSIQAAAMKKAKGGRR
ncbi:hypothetical protein SAMN05192583_0052 [Sphingomonas gellani]|uniref:Uncharacterized protein n=1 Tax=Sphingomonas gellani TaxID=1166340 RepID=A0A1H7Y4B5_9SPHN|nr:hypothetical protein [Sphingomonas gellani]SEM40029.1 hypothetical protein SAMN05192583_0052 [Sphingomonas gellani]